MARFPSKPQHGQPVIQAFGNSINQIIDYLPSLEVAGDGKSTFVTKSSAGTVIHAKQDSNTSKSSTEGETLSAGRYLQMITTQETSSGTVPLLHPILNCTLSGGNDIEITPQGVINYTGSGGSSGSGVSYIGDGNNSGSGHIFVDQSGSSPRLISSNLVYIDNLANYPISGNNIGTENHFVQVEDLRDGAGTIVDYHWRSKGDHTIDGGGPDTLVKWIDGICVNLNVSGGTYITTKFHQGVGYGDYSSASIDCNLSGTYDWFPHTSGFIAIVPQYDASQNITGGIISTNLHAGSGITIDPQTGEISCDGGGGGTIVIASGVQYPDYFNLSADTYQAEDNQPLSGGGISFLLPVKKDKNICFYTDAGDYTAFGTFASSLDEDAYRSHLANGVPYATSANGWARISVFDNGTHSGCCLRFTDNYSSNFDSNAWDHTTPLYRFHGLRNYSGDNKTIFINQNGVISGFEYTTSTPSLLSIDNVNHTISAAIQTAESGFKAPKYNLLNLGDNDAGITASGMGTTYLVPVSKGSSIWYEGTATVAIWVPVEGSNITTKHNVPNTSNSAWSTTDDGYVRLTVMDDGSNPGGCLKLHVGANGVLPLHKYNSTLSGAAGIIVENGGIRNMIQPGDGLTSSALMTAGANPVMTGIAFNLSSQFLADLTTISSAVQAANHNKVLSSNNNGTIVWTTNTAQGGGAEYTGIDPIVVNNSTHTISFNGSAGTGVPWPNYANLGNYSNTLDVQTNYTAGPAGGWLRISYKGEPTQQGSGSDAYCYSVYINGTPVGLYTLNSALGLMGNTWLLPIPPFAQFMVNFPSSPTHVYFDGTTAQYDDLVTNYSTISGIANSAKSQLNEVKSQYNETKDYARYAKEDWDDYLTAHTAWEEEEDPDPEYEPKPSDAEDYYSWWNDADDHYRYVLYYINEAHWFVTAAEEEYEAMQQAGTDSQNVASWYVEKTYSYYNEAQQYSTKAQAEVEKAHRYYLSACNYWNVSPQPLPNKDD